MKKYLSIGLLMAMGSCYAADSYQEYLQKLIVWAKKNPIHVTCFVAGAGGVYMADDFMIKEYPIMRKLMYATGGGLLCATYGPAVLKKYGVSAPDMPK